MCSYAVTCFPIQKCMLAALLQQHKAILVTGVLLQKSTGCVEILGPQLALIWRRRLVHLCLYSSHCKAPAGDISGQNLRKQALKYHISWCFVRLRIPSLGLRCCIMSPKPCCSLLGWPERRIMQDFHHHHSQNEPSEGRCCLT